MRYHVTTPVPDYTGVVGGVHFANGAADVDEDTNASELAYFRAQGYGVEEIEAKNEPRRARRTSEES
jgi:hypothetical protein